MYNRRNETPIRELSNTFDKDLTYALQKSTLPIHLFPSHCMIAGHISKQIGAHTYALSTVINDSCIGILLPLVFALALFAHPPERDQALVRLELLASAILVSAAVEHPQELFLDNRRKVERPRRRQSTVLDGFWSIFFRLIRAFVLVGVPCRPREGSNRKRSQVAIFPVVVWFVFAFPSTGAHSRQIGSERGGWCLLCN